LPPPRSTLFPYTTLFRSCPPVKSLTKPPDSVINKAPAAISQDCRPYSQKPSSRPAATQAKSKAAEPARRMPDVLCTISRNMPKRSEEHTSELQSRFDLVC